MITQCISSCQDLVSEFCSIDGTEPELQADCAAECSGSREWSFINGSLIGLDLIAKNGCDKYSPPKLFSPLPVKSDAWELSENERLALVMGILLFAGITVAAMPMGVIIL